MKNQYTVVPFHPCNDADRAAGVITGWDIQDTNGIRIETFDAQDTAQARCDEMNREVTPPSGYYLTSIFRGNTRTWIVAHNQTNDWLVCGQPDERTAVRRAYEALARAESGS